MHKPKSRSARRAPEKASAPQPVACLEIAAASHIGLVRKRQEDSYRVDADRGIAVVADGIGGHAGGHIASGLATSVIYEYLRSKSSPEEPTESEAAILRADAAIRTMAQNTESLHGMGTTVVSVVVREEYATVAHVGDSRAYILSAARDDFRLLTRDHSMRHALTQAVGTSRVPSVDLHSFYVHSGDVFLLCTDGLTGPLGDRKIFEILSEGMRENTLQETCGRLIQATLERGAPDNVTVALVRV